MSVTTILKGGAPYWGDLLHFSIAVGMKVEINPVVGFLIAGGNTLIS
ncbi:MAG: hypothetical protein JRH18_04765 [Deltaproteobacteria bacterium]|nr:hypothetical protein [Deltaproteobacteria bacterium]MBW2150956.1 hypothetical protein [Deltaproteobacteria bacterium]